MKYIAMVKPEKMIMYQLKKGGFVADSEYHNFTDGDTVFTMDMFKFCGKEIEIIDRSMYYINEYDYFQYSSGLGWIKEWLVPNSIRKVK